MLEDCRRNKSIFVRISKELEGCGFISCKIKMLRFEYKKIKDTRGIQGRKEWKCFEVMDQVLGHKPATCPPTCSRGSNCPGTSGTLPEFQSKNLSRTETLISLLLSRKLCLVHE